MLIVVYVFFHKNGRKSTTFIMTQVNNSSTFQVMKSKLNFIAEQEPWKTLSMKYYGIQTYLKEAISKSIMLDIQPHLLLNEEQIDDVVKLLLNNYQKEILEVMKDVSLVIQIMISS